MAWGLGSNKGGQARGFPWHLRGMGVKIAVGLSCLPRQEALPWERLDENAIPFTPSRG